MDADIRQSGRGDGLPADNRGWLDAPGADACPTRRDLVLLCVFAFLRFYVSHTSATDIDHVAFEPRAELAGQVARALGCPACGLRTLADDLEYGALTHPSLGRHPGHESGAAAVAVGKKA